MANSLESFDKLVNPSGFPAYLILSRSANGKGPPISLEQARLVMSTDTLAEIGVFLPEDMVCLEIEDQTIAEHFAKKDPALIIYSIGEKSYIIARDGKWRTTYNNTLTCGIKATTYGGGKTAQALLIPFKTESNTSEKLKETKILHFPKEVGPLPPLLKPLRKISKDEPDRNYQYPLSTDIENTLLAIHKNLSSLGYDSRKKTELVSEINEHLTADPLTQDEIDGFLVKNMLKAEMEEFFTSKGEFLHNKMGDYLIDRLNLKRDNCSKTLYYWDEEDKIYKSNDEVIKCETIKLYPFIKEYQREEVLNYVKLVLSTKDTYFNANPMTVVFKNGIMDILEKDLKEMTPENLETIQINCKYNPDAETTPSVEEFFKTASVNDPDVETLLYEAIGYAMLKTNELQKVFLLIGEGRNGKSTYLDIVREVLGPKNVTSISFKDLAGTFRASSLDNKLASVAGDISTQPLQESDLFKSISGGDPVMLEKKFKDAYEKSLFATMFFAANKLPRTPDTTEGFYRRLCIIPFQANLEGISRVEGLKFRRDLLSPKSIEYVAKRAIDSIYEVLNTTMDFTQSPRVQKNLEEYKIANSSTLSWFYDKYRGDCSKLIGMSTAILYADYKDWCQENNYGTSRSSNFEDQIKAHCKIRVDFRGKFAWKAEQTFAELGIESSGDLPF